MSLVSINPSLFCTSASVSAGTQCEPVESIAEKANLCVLCFPWMLTISIEDKISDVSSAGVWWFQFGAAGGRQPTGNTRFCSSFKKKSASLPSLLPPPSTVSAPN